MITCNRAGLISSGIFTYKKTPFDTDFFGISVLLVPNCLFCFIYSSCRMNLPIKLLLFSIKTQQGDKISKKYYSFLHSKIGWPNNLFHALKSVLLFNSPFISLIFLLDNLFHTLWQSLTIFFLRSLTICFFHALWQSFSCGWSNNLFHALKSFFFFNSPFISLIFLLDNLFHALWQSLTIFFWQSLTIFLTIFDNFFHAVDQTIFFTR